MLRVMAVLVVAALSLGDRALGYDTSRDSGYTAPEQSYEQPSYEAAGVGGSDITPILIGVLVLTGLALLFPSYVTLTSVRRKRSSEGNQALALLALAHRSLGLPDGVGGHHAHHADHGAVAAPVASGYQEPAAGYEAAADPGYAVPDTGYGTPDYDTGYGYQGYDAAAQEGYEVAEAENGMSMIIVPLLIAAALFLLFPSVREVAVRKRREADESPAANMVERVQDMYMALMESEECMERIACEVGGLVSDAGISKSMAKMAGQFVPKKYAKMMKTFNHGKDCKKNNKCGLF